MPQQYKKMDAKVVKNIKEIADGSYAINLSNTYSRNVTGGVIGGLAGAIYAFKTKGSILGWGLVGFVTGAAITGLIIKNKK